MTRQSAISRVLVLLLLTAALGCQTTGGVRQSTVSPAEQAGGAAKGEVPLTLEGARDKTSYSLGLDIGRDLKTQALELNLEPLLQGVRDGVKGDSYLLSDAELETVRRAFLKSRLAASAKALGPEAEKNFREGEAFLQENAKKEGVKTLASGLQYRVLKSGQGATPGPEKNVKGHFVVRSIDGKELESTRKQEQPGVFPVMGVIPAWGEALQLMKEGDTWELYAPSYLAYGEKGVGKAVGPFQTLIFELELIAIH